MGSKYRVLVVEDDPGALELLAEYLESDYEVATAQDAFSCLRSVTSKRPDLVLLDVMLPEVSGFDICQQIRADPTLAGVKVLMLTARGSAADLRRARDEGADAFLAKPFEVRDFRREVRRLLNLSGG